VIAKMVKVSLDLEESLHKAIRKKAIDKGITMKAYLIELIEKGKNVEEGEGIEETEEESVIARMDRGSVDI
jgi:hypothetical protein